MEIPLYQILVPLFCLMMIIKAWSHFLRKEKTIRELLAWLVFWGLIASTSSYPDLTSHLAGFLGIKSNVNAVVFAGLGVLCYLSFKVIVQIENLERQVTDLTREIALRDAQPKSHPAPSSPR